MQSLIALSCEKYFHHFITTVLTGPRAMSRFSSLGKR